jgi:hypothetical protein
MEVIVIGRREFVLGAAAAGVLMQPRFGYANASQPATNVNFDVPAGPEIRDEEILDSIKTHVLKKLAPIRRFGGSPGGCDASVTDGSAVQAGSERRIADGARGPGSV